MHIDPGHPDAASPLLQAAARVLGSLGAEVVVTLGDDNLIRQRRPDDPGTAPFVVVVAGLPNLLHELLHVLQVGRVADDHGIDYTQIPFDLHTPLGRQLLWQELACCVVSAAYLPTHLQVPWFIEQIEIQGVFFGCETTRDLAQTIDETISKFPEELPTTLTATYALAETALIRAGLARQTAQPAERIHFNGLWPALTAKLASEPPHRAS